MIHSSVATACLGELACCRDDRRVGRGIESRQTLVIQEAAPDVALPDGQRTRRRNLTYACVLIGCLLTGLAMLVRPVFAADIQLSLDRNPVPVNESFTLTYTADQEPDGDPDFSPLGNQFEILNQAQSSQFSIINGKASRQITWQLQVMAKESGTLQIPSIAFGSDRSRPFSVTVTHGPVRSRQGSEASLYLEAEAEPRNPYVQAQVILTIRVLSRVAFSGELSQPTIPDAVIEKLDEDREYLSLREGVQFKVNERRYAVFPQRSGRVLIGPVNLTAQLATGGGTLGPFFRPSTRQQRLHSEPIDLDVRPIPAQFNGKQWLPVASLTLEDQWLPASQEVPGGEPLTRTLTVTAEGATSGMLPDLAGAATVSGDLRLYPDQPVTGEDKTASGLSSRRQQKTALIAIKPGTHSTPAVNVPWWNTRADKLEVAHLPARTVTILPAPVSAAAQPPAPPPEPSIPADDTADVKDAAASGDPVSAALSPNFFNLALPVMLGLGWLSTALAWWYSARRRAGVQARDPAPSLARHDRVLASIRELRKACRDHDPLVARRALMRWASWRWPGLTAAEREDRLHLLLGTEMATLNRHAYGSPVATGAWRGHGVMERLERLERQKGEAGAAGKSGLELEPLHL